MKKIIAALAVLASVFCVPAFAKDYTQGLCPVSPVCYFGSGVLTTDSFSDTSTFSIGNNDGKTYVGSSEVKVYGGRFCIDRTCGYVYIDSALLDGVSLTPPNTTFCPPGSAAQACYTWSIPISLPAGTHKVSVTGHVEGQLIGDPHWTGAVEGVKFE